MQSPADTFLDSLKLPSPDKFLIQVNQSKEKLQDTKSILALLQETLEATEQLPASEDRALLLKELESNINRHKVLIERETIKLTAREEYLQHATRAAVGQQSIAL